MVNFNRFWQKQEVRFGFIALGIVLIDQIVKQLVLLFKPVWNLLLATIHYVQNTGAGFGILKGQTLWLGVVSLLVAVGVIWYYPKIPKEKWPQVLFAVFLGGVLGNLIDRLFRGYVIDYMDLGFWPAFNLADACISVSVIGLIVYYWKK